MTTMKYRFLPYVSMGEPWYRIERGEVSRTLFGRERVEWRYQTICRPDEVEKIRKHLESPVIEVS